MPNSNDKNKIKLDDFFKLPVKEQEAIMNEVADSANKDQISLVRKSNKIINSRIKK